MNLDTFLISILFDDAKALSSANKIDGIVKNLSASIVKSFTAILSIDFLKNAIESTVELSTKLNNLSYTTGASVSQLNAWGEAVKRNGGTVEQFYSSVSNLSQKIREIQTNFGSSGQLAFVRLGINIKDANGHLKNGIQILGDLATKFQKLPKTWQLKLGESLGLDQGTIRLLSKGNIEAQKLVKNMAELGQINENTVQSSIKFRNAMYDLQLVWRSVQNQLATSLIPLIKTFAHYLQKTILYFRNNPKLIESALIAIGTVITAILIPAFLRLAITMSPFLALGAVIAGLTLIIQDFIVWLRGGKSAFGEFYDKIFGSAQHFKELGDKLLEFFNKHKKALKLFAEGIGAIVLAIGGLRLAMGALSIVAGTTEIVMGGLAVAFSPIGLAIAGVTSAIIFLIQHFKELKGYYKDYIDYTHNLSNKITDTVKNTGSAISHIYDVSKQAVVGTISNVAQSLGFDKNKALTIANIESGLNPNARPTDKTGKPIGSASGLFQLINDTAKRFGIRNLANKNNPEVNATAGIKNLKFTNDALAKYLGRQPTGGELYLGEMLGIGLPKKPGGVFNVLKANPNSPLSSILSASTLKSNPQFKNLTAGQLISNANRTYQSKSISMGDVNITAHNTDGHAVAKTVGAHIQKQLNGVVTNMDNGIKS